MTVFIIYVRFSRLDIHADRVINNATVKLYNKKKMLVLEDNITGSNYCSLELGELRGNHMLVIRTGNEIYKKGINII